MALEGRFSLGRTSRVLLSSGAIGGSRFIQLAFVFLTFPLLLHELGPVQFSLWAAITSILTMQPFFDLGMSNALMNSVVDSAGRDDLDEARRMISSAVVVLLVLAAGIVVLVICSYPFIDWGSVYKVEGPDATQAGLSTALVLLSIGIMVPMHVTMSVRRACQEIFVHSCWDASAIVLSFVMIVLSVAFHANLISVVFATVGPSVIMAGSNTAFLFFRDHKKLCPRLRYADLGRMTTLLKQSALFFLISVGTILGLQSDNLVAVHTMGAETSAHFAIIFKVIGAAQGMWGILLIPVWPAYADAVARQDYGWLKRMIISTTLTSTLCAMAASVLLHLYGREGVALWTGAEVDQPLIDALAIWFPIYSFGTALSTLFNVSRFLIFQTAVWSAFGVVAIGFKFWFAEMYGFEGIVWGTMFAFSIVIVAYAAMFLNRDVMRFT